MGHDDDSMDRNRLSEKHRLRSDFEVIFAIETKRYQWSFFESLSIRTAVFYFDAVHSIRKDNMHR